MFKKAFYLWADIAIFMFFIIVVDYMLFEDLIFYWGLYFYAKGIFITIFVLTILISVFVVGYFFEKHGIISYKNRFIGYKDLFCNSLEGFGVCNTRCRYNRLYLSRKYRKQDCHDICRNFSGISGNLLVFEK